MYTIKAETLGDAWIEALKLIMSEGEDILDEEIKLKEIRNLYITINSIDEDNIIRTYADKERIRLMKQKYCTCGLVGHYKIDYGSYIFNNNGINQIEWVRNKITQKPETKSATITLHRPGEDMLACLSLLDFKLRNNKLDMSAVYRSQNVYFSQPGNMLALKRIQNDLAKKINVEAGKVELIIMSAHVYEKHYERTIEILDKV